MTTFLANLIIGDAADTLAHQLNQLTPVVVSEDPSVREFRSSCVIHDGNSVVQKGTLFRAGESDVTAICKFVLGGDLTHIKREANLYMDPYHLKNLQGRHVPRFYGYYEGIANDFGREVTMGCMILEDCGRGVTLAERTKDSIKRQIVHSLLWLHHKGHLRHGDIEFDFRHFLINDSGSAESIRIVDFDHSAAHKCSQTGGFEMYNYQPPRPTFDCQELYQAFCRIGAWTPDRIRFAGWSIQIFRAPTVKRLMKVANYYYPEDDNSWLEPKAQQILDYYYRTYQSRFKTIGHPLQLKQSIGIPEVPDSDDEDEDAKMPPFEKPEWKTVTLEHT